MRLAGKRLLGFDTAGWADPRDGEDIGRTAFAMVGGKDQKSPAPPAHSPSR